MTNREYIEEVFVSNHQFMFWAAFLLFFVIGPLFVWISIDISCAINKEEFQKFVEQTKQEHYYKPDKNAFNWKE